jgi:hypothetical protein
VNFSRVLLDLILDIFYTGWLGAQHLTHLARPRAEQYLRVLLVLAGVTIVTPAIPALIGLVGGWSWLVALAGLLWGISALLLFILAAPLGILINGVLGILGLQATVPRVGRRYVVYTGTVLLFGMFAALMAALLPWRSNPAAIPFIFLAAVILAVAGAAFGTGGVLGRGMVIFVTSLVLVALVTSLIFPRTFSAISSARSGVDQYLADVISGKDNAGLPICAETAETHRLNSGNPRISFAVHPDCWSGWVSIRTEKKSSFRFYKEPNEGFLEVHFWDGTRQMVHQDQSIWFGHVPRAEFRLRGSGGMVVIQLEPLSP